MQMARRRASGTPLQYVIGVAAFRRIDLAVGPGVFVPRPETEMVVDRALEHLPESGSLLDVGTGSGAIALAVAYERPDARVVATEVSETAIRWARENQARLNLEIELYLGDLFEGLPERLARSFDVVVSNPPYVAEAARDILPREVVDHEPHDALFGGAEGVDLILRLAEDAPQWLRPGGHLVVEIGSEQGDRVAEILTRAGWSDVGAAEDLAGRERIAEGRWSG